MNVLIIGLGSIARKHMEALQVLNMEVNLYALRSKVNSAEELGVQNIYDLENVTTQFDFAIISNPTYLHDEFIEKLAKKNIPLFIEKPAVGSLDNVDRLLELIESKNLLTYVACNLRFHPCIVFLKDKIAAESLRINELNVYCGSYLPNWRPQQDFRTIYSANAAMGGGVHLDLFHELDYTTWLFGLPNKSHSILKSSSSLAIDAVDYANFILEYDDFTASIILNYYRRQPKREIEIVLEQETWTIDLLKNEIKNDAGASLFKVAGFNVKETYISQLSYFMNCLRKHKVPMNSFKESLANLKICLNHG